MLKSCETAGFMNVVLNSYVYFKKKVYTVSRE